MSEEFQDQDNETLSQDEIFNEALTGLSKQWDEDTSKAD